MNIINILLGIVVLLTGRKLFWLFIAALGFLVGASLGPRFIEADPAWLIWLFSLGLGVVGALLAVFLQRFAISLAGFVGGWYLTMTVMTMYEWHLASPNTDWVVYLIGGLILSGIVSALADLALIVLSSIVGALAIMQGLALNFAPLVTTLILLVLVFVGFSVQSRALHLEPERPKKPAKPAPPQKPN